MDVSRAGLMEQRRVVNGLILTKMSTTTWVVSVLLRGARIFFPTFAPPDTQKIHNSGMDVSRAELMEQRRVVNGLISMKMLMTTWILVMHGWISTKMSRTTEISNAIHLCLLDYLEKCLRMRL
jgi:hypothetical protein